MEWDNLERQKGTRRSCMVTRRGTTSKSLGGGRGDFDFVAKLCE